jgi:hypothetical protein
VETTDEVVQLVGECVIIRRAVALTAWVGPEGKALTRVGVLSKPVVRELADVKYAANMQATAH